MTKSCEMCVYWDNSTQHRDAQQDTTGLCHVNPPTTHIMTGYAVWPFTEGEDWCGKYEVDPQKLPDVDPF